MKRIFVLYTGGTIGMIEGVNGLRPDTQMVETALTPFSGSLKFDWHVCDPLIDSSAVTPHDWANWLALLQEKIPHYDGVLVLHGTDTLAYTANFLALTLDTHNKPIILTGAQQPLSAENSDAPVNLKVAIDALMRDDVYGVVIAFYRKLYQAIGSSKISTQSDDGFANLHFGTWHTGQVMANVSGSLKREFSPQTHVLPIYFTPANDMVAIIHLLNHCSADALILQTYGHGNAPNYPEFLVAIKRFIAQGKLVLNISQVAQGCVAAVYEQGHALREAGVINGGKCNIETATILMMLAAHNGWTAQEVVSQLQQLNLL